MKGLWFYDPCFDEKHAQLFYYPGYPRLPDWMLKASFTKISARLFIVFICLWINAEVFLKAIDGLAITLEQAENY